MPRARSCNIAILANVTALCSLWQVIHLSSCQMAVALRNSHVTHMKEQEHVNVVRAKLQKLDSQQCPKLTHEVATASTAK